ncbi:unnamed protein product [Calicophoron daubneyi]|uniref:Uncharacterized protein n=1 Tax=Calicophoron daubneyi TaxID=300641 RepID=A0AAV2T286_CALDB
MTGELLVTMGRLVLVLLFVVTLAYEVECRRRLNEECSELPFERCLPPLYCFKKGGEKGTCVRRCVPVGQKCTGQFPDSCCMHLKCDLSKEGKTGVCVKQ